MYFVSEYRFNAFRSRSRKALTSLAAQPMSKLKPILTVPFKRDPNFVGREDIMTQVGSVTGCSSSQEHNRVALVGLGGVG